MIEKSKGTANSRGARLFQDSKIAAGTVRGETAGKLMNRLVLGAGEEGGGVDSSGAEWGTESRSQGFFILQKTNFQLVIVTAS